MSSKVIALLFHQPYGCFPEILIIGLMPWTYWEKSNNNLIEQSQSIKGLLGTQNILVLILLWELYNFENSSFSTSCSFDWSWKADGLVLLCALLQALAPLSKIVAEVNLVYDVSRPDQPNFRGVASLALCVCCEVQEPKRRLVWRVRNNWRLVQRFSCSSILFCGTLLNLLLWMHYVSSFATNTWL